MPYFTEVGSLLLLDKTTKMKALLTSLIIISFSQISFSQSSTFAMFGYMSYAGTQHIKVDDLAVDVTIPYRIPWSIEGHYMTDDIYYIGRALSALSGGMSVTENGETYENLNGAYVDFSLGGFNEVNENFGYGIGLRSNFGFTGLRRYDGSIDNFHFNLGLESPMVYSLNKYFRLYSRVSVSNVWTNHEVFGGWQLDASADFHVSPFRFLTLGVGVGTDYSSRSIRQNTSDLMRMQTTSLYYRWLIAISLFGNAQGM